MKIRRLIKNFIESSSGNLGGQLLGFFVVSYLGRVLGPTEYGFFNFIQSYLFYFYTLTDLGLSLYLIKEVNQSKNKFGLFQEIFSLRIYLSLFITFIYFISIYFLGMPLDKRVPMYLAGTSVFFTGVYIDSFFVAKNNMKYIGLTQFIKSALYLFLSIIFVKSANDVVLAIVAYSSGIFISTLTIITFFKKVYKEKLFMVKIPHIILIFKNALPLALTLFMIQINNNFDILYLTFNKKSLDVGYYSAAYRIINVLISILIVYFNASYGTVAELIHTDSKKLNQFIRNFYKIGVVFIVPITVGGICLSDKIMKIIFGNAFISAGIYLALLFPLLIIRLISSTYISVITMAGLGKQLSICIGIGALLNVVLNIVLVPKFSAVGSSLATITCEIIQGIFLYYYYRKICSEKFSKITMLTAISCAPMVIVLYFFNLSLFSSILIGAILYFIFYSLFDIKFVIRVLNVMKNIVFK